MYHSVWHPRVSLSVDIWNPSRCSCSLELGHGLTEFVFNGVQVRDQVTARVLDGLRWLLVLCGLALNLNAVLEGVWLAIASELDGLVSEQLEAHDVTQGVVFVDDAHNRHVYLLLVDRHLLRLRLVYKHGSLSFYFYLLL